MFFLFLAISSLFRPLVVNKCASFIVPGDYLIYYVGSFIGEETVSAGGSCNLTNNPTWIIDPIDGTTNFVHR